MIAMNEGFSKFEKIHVQNNFDVAKLSYVLVKKIFRGPGEISIRNNF